VKIDDISHGIVFGTVVPLPWNFAVGDPVSSARNEADLD